jgi:hypothetical protein
MNNGVYGVEFRFNEFSGFPEVRIGLVLNGVKVE